MDIISHMPIACSAVEIQCIFTFETLVFISNNNKKPHSI